nr:hypothetical protein [Saccharothrix sp.]
MFLDAAQGRGQVGHDLLRADDPDRVTRTARVGGELAAAARGQHQRPRLGDRGDAVDDEVRGRDQPADLVTARRAVDGQDAGPDGVVPAAGVEVVVDAGQPEGFAGSGEHAGTLGDQVLDADARGCGIVQDLCGEAVGAQRLGDALQLRGRGRVGERRGRGGVVQQGPVSFLSSSPDTTTQPLEMSGDLTNRVAALS